MVNIFILNIIAFIFMLGVNFTYGIFPAFLKSFGATEFIISLSASALYITRGTSSIFLSKLSKKVSFRNLFIIAFIGSAISTMFLTIPHNPTVISLFRMVQGLFSGFFWVLINIYAISLGSKSFDKLKNLSSVTIFINFGAFLGSTLSGKVATDHSPYVSFFIGAAALLIGAFGCLFLEDIREEKKDQEGRKEGQALTYREKTIVFFGILSSFIYSYISIGIPLFILQLGGSYKEIGITSGLGVLAGALAVSISPWLRKKFSYGTIIKVDYSIIIFNIISIFYFKSILVIYVLQSILTGIVTLERNMWFATLHEHSKNYNKSIGYLRGFMDYFGAALFLIYGFTIQHFGSINVAILMGILTFVFLITVSTIKQLRFLKHSKVVHIHGVVLYNQILFRVGE